MPKHYFLVRCPGCGHDMMYHTDSMVLAGKSKRCVYCGRNFSVKDRVVKHVRRQI